MRHCLSQAGGKADGTHATIHGVGAAASLSGVIRKVLFIQKSTIPDSIKLQTNEEAGKKIICLTTAFTGGEAGGLLLNYKIRDSFKGCQADRDLCQWGWWGEHGDGGESMGMVGRAWGW